MHPSVLALCLVALQSLEPADSAPNPDSSPLLASNWGNQRRYVHLQTSSELSNFYLEISLHGHVRRSANRGSYSVVLLKAETRDRLAILGVKSNRFLCMDAEGKLYSSAVCNQEQCLFNHKLLENHRDVYYSAKTGMLVNLEGARQVYSAGQSPPQTSLFLSERNTVPLERLLHREKRNRHVNPSDPFNTYGYGEGSDSHAVAEDEADQEPEGGHISMESPVFPSDEDPWNLHFSHPSSPRLNGIMG
ncbi:fibroblast growth factor 23-like [Denticeps clupeoides]|uniref:FGF n=1 Tax=Denticeps clupeoides TaxID=299321 RepID=A0AAY4B8I5_9TELE|nr:fibroblast growth factor 23 [Denticeps clupeoides]